MPRRKKAHRAAIARLQAGRARARLATQTGPPNSALPNQAETTPEPLRGPLPVVIDPLIPSTASRTSELIKVKEEIVDEVSLEELQPSDLPRSAETSKKSAYEELMKPKSERQWAMGERKLRGPYTGGAARTHRTHQLKVHDKDIADALIQES